MAKKCSVPRGTKDIFPEEIPQWLSIEHSARNLFNVYGYREIRTPLFEETALFLRSLGQTSEVVNKQLLNVVSSAKEEGSESETYSLRPEGTASVVRAYIENDLDKKELLTKLFYIGPMFRGERPQKGRLRQFHQIGVEVLGKESASAHLDAELISLNVHLLKNFGISDFTLKINTLGTKEDKESFSKKLREQLKAHESTLSPESKERLSRNVFRILDSKDPRDKEIVAKLDLGHDYLSAQSKEYYEQLKKILTTLAIPFEETLNLVRGLDYYTHTVFEITSKSLGSQDALSAGGRYNNLVEELGGSSIDAVGFALGIERVLLALGTKEADLAKRSGVYLVALDEESLKVTNSLIFKLRQEGIPSDMGYKLSSMKSQMRLADKSGLSHVLIVGEEERKKGIVALKNLVNGQQQEVQATVSNVGQLIKIFKT